jgi:hypothetical protein
MVTAHNENFVLIRTLESLLAFRVRKCNRVVITKVQFRLSPTAN